ncbi:hypothetical protein D3C78_1220740 [compost metagenome]
MAEGFIALVQIAGRQGLQLVQNGGDFPIGNPLGLVLASKVLAKIINNQHLTLVLAWHIATDKVGIAGLLCRGKMLPQQRDNGLFQFCFRENMAHGGGFLLMLIQVM